MTKSYHINELAISLILLATVRSLNCLLLASERSERDTIRGVQIRAGAVYIYIYICMEVRMP